MERVRLDRIREMSTVTSSPFEIRRMTGKGRDVLRDKIARVEVDILFDHTVLTEDLKAFSSRPPLEDERDPHIAQIGDGEFHVAGHVFNKRAEGFEEAFDRISSREL